MTSHASTSDWCCRAAGASWGCQSAGVGPRWGSWGSPTASTSQTPALRLSWQAAPPSRSSSSTAVPGWRRSPGRENFVYRMRRYNPLFGLKQDHRNYMSMISCFNPIRKVVLSIPTDWIIPVSRLSLQTFLDSVGRHVRQVTWTVYWPDTPSNRRIQSRGWEYWIETGNQRQYECRDNDFPFSGSKVVLSHPID